MRATLALNGLNQISKDFHIQIPLVFQFAECFKRYSRYHYVHILRYIHTSLKGYIKEHFGDHFEGDF